MWRVTRGPLVAGILLAVGVAVLAPRPALAQASPCDEERLRVAARVARALLRCEARAEARGIEEDTRCVGRALRRMGEGGRFARLSARPDCSEQGGSDSTSRALRAFAESVAQHFDPAGPATDPSSCAAARDRCVRKVVKVAARCHGAALRDGVEPSDACLDDARSRLGDASSGCFARAAGRGDCPTTAVDPDAVAQQAVEIVDFLARLLARGPDALVRSELLPESGEMMSWIETVFDQGIRRPGYPANEWAIAWSRDRFEEEGLESVMLDPIPASLWEPTGWSLDVWNDATPSQVVRIPSYPIPFTSPTTGVEAPLVASDAEGGHAGALAVYESSLLAMPQSFLMLLWGRWAHDPTNEFESLVQVLPFDLFFHDAFESSLHAGALGFIGILNFPWETDRYYYPYNANVQPVPGLWVSPANGATLRSVMQAGPARGRVVLERNLESVTSHNVIGTLPGASDEWIVIGSHHDGPWASAVEDGSGIALVLAQARYWAQVPVWERPHNMLFLLNGGHMSGGSGLIDFVESNLSWIQEDLVAEIHLEHAALETEGQGGELVPTGRPEVRWWFTSQIAPLEDAVAEAICAEDLDRSIMMPEEDFPPGNAQPPTDGAFFHPHSPIVHFLAAPMYLFAEADTMDKVDEASLAPLSRAAVRIVQSLRNHDAAGLRAGRYQAPRAEPIAACAL